MSNPFDMPRIDTRPGLYYVTMLRDDGTYLPLLGPLDGHQEALDRVRICSLYAAQLDSRATWCAFGTCRVELGAPGAVMEGLLNDRWPLRYAPGSQLVEREEPFERLETESGPTGTPAAALDFMLYKKGHQKHFDGVVATLPSDVYLCATAQWQLVNAMRQSLVEMERGAGSPTGGLEAWVIREFARCSLSDSFALAQWLEFRPGFDWVTDWLFDNLKTRVTREGQQTPYLSEVLSDQIRALMKHGRPREVDGDTVTKPGCLADGKGPPGKKRPSRSRKGRARSGDPA